MCFDSPFRVYWPHPNEPRRVRGSAIAAMGGDASATECLECLESALSKAAGQGLFMQQVPLSALPPPRARPPLEVTL